MAQPRQAVILTGSTGYLGGVLAAGLLTDPSVRLILPVRARHSRDGVLARIAAEISPVDRIGADWPKRITVLPLPATNEIPGMARALRREGVAAIVHCAGCVDYFHTQNLNEGNVDLTAAVVSLSQELRVGRF